jgi:uncharacterized protein (DUF488 family)
MNPTALYTIGYEGLEIDAFVSRLRNAGVQTIVDVRGLPLSRKAGFSKRSFAARLEAAGIAYLHKHTLGCPKEVRDRYRKDSDWARYTRGFLAHLAKQESCVRELATLADFTSVCLVCFEADFSMCHRTYVARAAHRMGGPAVRHITSRTVVPDQPLLVAA